MRYQRIDNNKIEIQPEGMHIRDMLLTIAEVSYKTAIPRGLGFRQPYIHLVKNTPDFQDCIETQGGQPVMLLMDYINGRDCRTKVFRARDEKWYLDSYAFQQRKVTSQEFIQGIVRDSADKFLDKVVQEIESQGGN